MKLRKRYRILKALPAVALFLALILVYAAALRYPAAETMGNADRPTLVIDPGHGGIDGGALAFDGTKESNINLEIGLKLRELAKFCGYDFFMTREDDSRRTDILSYSEHEDLVHRTELINSVPHGVLISIHQNFFPTSQPSGAQVLYAPGEESRRFGELTHGELISLLQPENRRVAVPAPKELYITSKVNCPAILVECGFLSNPSDLSRLKEDDYQTQIALVLNHSFLEYTSDKTYT